MHGSVAIPVVSFKYEFTASGGVVTPSLETSNPAPFQHIPKAWALQVTGYDVNGAVAAPTSWTVLLLGSLDKVFADGSVILQHVNTASANSVVVFSGASSFPCNFVGLKCSALTLGATAIKIVVTVLGVF